MNLLVIPLKESQNIIQVCEKCSGSSMISLAFSHISEHVCLVDWPMLIVFRCECLCMALYNVSCFSMMNPDLPRVYSVYCSGDC